MKWRESVFPPKLEENGDKDEDREVKGENSKNDKTVAMKYSGDLEFGQNKEKKKTHKVKTEKEKSTKGHRKMLLCLVCVQVIEKSDKHTSSKALPPPLPSLQT